MNKNHRIDKRVTKASQRHPTTQFQYPIKKWLKEKPKTKTKKKERER